MNSQEIAIYDSHRDLSSKPFRSGCFAGYTSMLFDSVGRIRVCSVNSECILGDIRTQRIDEIWNGSRRRMLCDALDRYDFGLGCSECELKIRSGILEGATTRNSQLSALKFDQYEMNTTDHHWPKHMEFHLSNKCNLECVTCSGEYSSLIRARREKLPPHVVAYGDQFFDDLRKYLPHLDEVVFKGGEPFLIPEMYRIWNMLIEDNLTPVCHITTNGTVFGPEVERVLNCLPASVNVSMDGITRETFESVRLNAKLDRVLRNSRRIRDIVVSRGFVFGFNFTLSRWNWHEFVDFLLFAESENVPVSVSNVRFPVEQSVFSWDAPKLQSVIDHLERQCDIVGNRLKRNMGLLTKKIQELRFEIHRRHEETENPVSLVGMFQDAVAGPETMLYSKARVLAMLSDWGGTNGLCEIECDLDDRLTSFDARESSLFACHEETGLKFADLIMFMFQKHGSKISHRSLEQDKGHIDRTFQVEGGSAGPIEVRVIMTPLFDGDGKLKGARAVFANKGVDI